MCINLPFSSNYQIKTCEKWRNQSVDRKSNHLLPKMSTIGEEDMALTDERVSSQPPLSTARGERTEKRTDTSCPNPSRALETHGEESAFTLSRGQGKH
jgi:hypothetical protein